jgi:hypothetical protein
MPVRRPEYATSETCWVSAGPRILSYTWLVHRNTEGRPGATRSDDLSSYVNYLNSWPMAAMQLWERLHNGVLKGCHLMGRRGL